MQQRTKYEISQVIQRFLPEVELQGGLSGHQRSTLKLMSLCKTSALGGHKERCNRCQYTRIHYNSCGNRNCPTCQGVNKEKWVHERQNDLLPVKYFHCVYTIPSELYIYFRYNKKLLYDLLFGCVRQTLLALGWDPKHGIGGRIGGICILHSWTRQMSYHPHIHCIVPAGGLTKQGKWEHAKAGGNFLFPVGVMSRLFRGKLLAGLHKLYKAGKLRMTNSMVSSYAGTKDKLYKKDWIVYSKRAFGGPEQVLEYLGRYTHKICISNHRIVEITATHVRFKYWDRKAKEEKQKVVRGRDFIRLFAEHILPKGFVKIRHFGILASRVKKTELSKARKSLGASPPPLKVKLSTREFMLMTTGKDPYACPCCGKGQMVIIAIIPAMRGSPVRPPMRFFAKDRKVNIV